LPTRNQWIGIGAAGALLGFVIYKNSLRSKVVAKALSYKSVPYVLGGSSYTRSDCSGMTRNAYRSIGIELPRVAREQIKVGTEALSLKPGDVVYYKSGGAHDHVGIYTGNGNIFHCSYSKGSCYQDTLARWKKVKIFHGARRII